MFDKITFIQPTIGIQLLEDIQQEANNLNFTSTAVEDTKVYEEKLYKEFAQLEKCDDVTYTELKVFEAKLAFLFNTEAVTGLKYRMKKLRALYEVVQFLQTKDESDVAFIETLRVQKTNFSIATICPLKTSITAEFKALLERYAQQLEVKEVADEIQQIQSAKQLESFLLEEIQDDFINIGKIAREWVTEQLLPQLNVLQDREKLIQATKQQMTTHQEMVATVHHVKTTTEMIEKLTALGITALENELTEVVEVIFNRLQQVTTPFNNTMEIECIIKSAQNQLTEKVRGIDGTFHVLKTDLLGLTTTVELRS